MENGILEHNDELYLFQMIILKKLHFLFISVISGLSFIEFFFCMTNLQMLL